MFKLAADHNVDGDILRGVRRRVPDVDLVRAVDAGLSAATDPEILECTTVDEWKDRVLYVPL